MTGKGPACVTKRSNLILLTLALLLALCTTFVVVNQMTQWRANQSSEKKVQVVMVAKPLSAHSLISATDVELQSVPQSAVEDGAVTSLQAAVGHYSTGNWYAGQQVIADMVMNNNQAAAFPLSVPTGQRAYTISNDAVTGVDHLLSPGDRVDILVTYDKVDGGKGAAGIVLQNILVLHADNVPEQSSAAAVNSTSSQSNSNSQAVDTLTVALSPQQAVDLEYARTFGKIHIMLRNPQDNAAVPVSPVQQPVMGQ